MSFRPDVLSFADLLAHAERTACAQRVFTTTPEQLATARAAVGERAAAFEPSALRDAQESDQHYYLGRSPMRWLPLTPGQARRVNAALGLEVIGAPAASREAPTACLSPRQHALLAAIEAALGEDPEALAELERPADLGALDEYERVLRGLLD